MTGVLADPGPLPMLAWLPVSHLWVDRDYQRTIDTPRSQSAITRIAAEFKWSAFQAVPAVKHGAGWRIIDGQHRCEAAKRRGIAEIPAVVVENISVAEQAAAFVQANRDRVPVNPFALYRAQLVAGDLRALAIDEICRAAGIEIAPYAGTANYRKPGETLALGTLALIARRYGGDIAILAAKAVAEPYRDIVGALRAPFFDGAARYIHDCKPRHALGAETGGLFSATTSPTRSSAAWRRKSVPAGNNRAPSRSNT